MNLFKVFKVSQESYDRLQASGAMSVRRIIRFYLPEHEMPGYEEAQAVMRQVRCEDLLS